MASVKLPGLQPGGRKVTVGSEFVSRLFLEKHVNDNRKKWVWEGIGCPLVAVLLFPVILTFFNPWASSNTAA